MYDLVIIGAGWAGFNAALRAKELGLKTALMERSAIGGTCLNSGCIPTKTLIQSAKSYVQIKKSKSFGITIPSGPEINFSEIQSRKAKIILQLKNGMESMLRGVDILHGEAVISGPQEVDLYGEKISTRSILIASGSIPVELSNLRYDGKKIISSNELLLLSELPESLLIVGGGVIGCEFASLFSALGVRVTIAEYASRLLPGMDSDVSRKLENCFRKKGIQVVTGADIATFDLSVFTYVAVCAGRKPYFEGLQLEKIGVKTTNSGGIIVDDFLRSSVPGIFAAGDCASKIMLAHFASYEGRLAVENIASPGKEKKVSFENIPACVFTDPEIAAVGLTEEQARERGIKISVKKFDFLGSGMARILDETDGFIKIVIDTTAETICGASIIGPRATELISLVSCAVQSRMPLQQFKTTIIPHPSISEAIIETVR